MLVEFECPVCKGHICERWSRSGSNFNIRAMYWHAYLNPGLAINELIFGQRTPSEMFVCTSCTSPLIDRCYVHCKSCGEFHIGRIWSYGNAFRNWIGLVCPTCSAEIPCQWNLTSQILLAVSSPLWWAFVKNNKDLLLQRQFKRITENKLIYLDKNSNKPKKVSYWKMGLKWAIFMNLIFTVPAVYYFVTVSDLTGWSLLGASLVSALLGLLVWIPAGAAFAFTLKIMLDKKGDKNTLLTFDENGAVISLHEQETIERKRQEPEL